MVGYFANAQYDEKKSVIASRRRGNPLEKVWSIYFITLVVGYFAYAQYDVLFLYVILSMSSEQTCLQILAKQKRAPKPKRFRGAF